MDAGELVAGQCPTVVQRQLHERPIGGLLLDALGELCGGAHRPQPHGPTAQEGDAVELRLPGRGQLHHDCAFLLPRVRPRPSQGRAAVNHWPWPRRAGHELGAMEVPQGDVIRLGQRRRPQVGQVADAISPFAPVVDPPCHPAVTHEEVRHTRRQQRLAGGEGLCEGVGVGVSDLELADDLGALKRHEARLGHERQRPDGHPTLTVSGVDEHGTFAQRLELHLAVLAEGTRHRLVVPTQPDARAPGKRLGRSEADPVVVIACDDDDRATPPGREPIEEVVEGVLGPSRRVDHVEDVPRDDRQIDRMGIGQRDELEHEREVLSASRYTREVAPEMKVGDMKDSHGARSSLAGFDPFIRSDGLWESDDSIGACCRGPGRATMTQTETPHAHRARARFPHRPRSGARGR